jgi:hypothetical protein
MVCLHAKPYWCAFVSALCGSFRARGLRVCPCPGSRISQPLVEILLSWSGHRTVLESARSNRAAHNRLFAVGGDVHSACGQLCREEQEFIRLHPKIVSPENIIACG